MTLSVSHILSSSPWRGQVLCRSRDGISGELELNHVVIITHPPSQFVLSSSSELQENLYLRSQGKLISSCSLWGVSVAFGICDDLAFDMRRDLSYGRADACWGARKCCFRQIPVPLTSFSRERLVHPVHMSSLQLCLSPWVPAPCSGCPVTHILTGSMASLPFPHRFPDCSEVWLRAFPRSNPSLCGELSFLPRNKLCFPDLCLCARTDPCAVVNEWVFYVFWGLFVPSNHDHTKTIREISAKLSMVLFLWKLNSKFN